MYFNFPKEYFVYVVNKNIDIYEYGFRSEDDDIDINEFEELPEIYDEEYAIKSVNDEV